MNSSSSIPSGQTQQPDVLAAPHALSAVERPAVRLVSRLDVKVAAGALNQHSAHAGAGVRSHNLVKGIHLEGLRVLGDPVEYASRYYQEGADEILYTDVVASLYNRNSIEDLVDITANRVYVPMTVGGGIRSVSDIHRLLRAGADKIAINTEALRRPAFITEAARIFGSQCVVVSIQAKRRDSEGWEAYSESGREPSGRDVVAWALEAVDRGAGEILLTSVDQEGTRKGFDLELIASVAPLVPVPVVACGGAGTVDHVVNAIQAGADAVAMASMFHYGLETVTSLRAALLRRGLPVRE